MESQLEMRALGHTDIAVTPIGLGMMEFAGGGGLMGFAFPLIPQDEKNATVRAGLEGGVNWFDTAELYGNGISEASLSKALKAAGKRDADVVVATKWWPLFRTAGNIRRTIDARMRYLDGYSIGLYMVHQPFGLSSREAEMNAMADLVEAGKIRSVGVSNFSPEQMRRAHKALQDRGSAAGGQPGGIQPAGSEHRAQRCAGDCAGTGRHHHCVHSAGFRVADGQVSQAARSAEEEADVLARQDRAEPGEEPPDRGGAGAHRRGARVSRRARSR